MKTSQIFDGPGGDRTHDLGIKRTRNCSARRCAEWQRAEVGRYRGCNEQPPPAACGDDAVLHSVLLPGRRGAHRGGGSWTLGGRSRTEPPSKDNARAGPEDKPTPSDGLERSTPSLPSSNEKGPAGKRESRGQESRARRRNRPKTSNRARPTVPEVVFPKCSSGSRLPLRTRQGERTHAQARFPAPERWPQTRHYV